MYIEKLLEDITRVLDSINIPYLLTGSLAYNIYALPRATRDIDLIVEIQAKDIKTFLQAIAGSYYYSEETINQEVKRRGMFNIIHLESSYKIDLIVRSDDVFEKAKFRRRKAMEFGGTLLYVITLEDLIISKLRWIQQLESELHKRDIETLLLNPDIDKEYVKNWCERLNLKTYNLI